MKKVLLLICVFSAQAFAVTPAVWQHNTEANFTNGEFENTTVTSRGEIILTRQFELILPSDVAPGIVSTILPDGKAIYAGSGTEGIIYKVEGDKMTTLVELPALMINCMLKRGNELIVGVGGGTGGIYSVTTDGKFKPLWTDPAIKYVWAILEGPNGSLYAATGPTGKVFVINAQGKAEVLFEAEKNAKNILCLTKADSGLLYAGTDQNGLIVEIDPAKKTSRIVFDAPEKEVAAIVLDGNGGMYAATSEAAKASPDGKTAPNGGGKNGRTPRPTPPQLNPKASPQKTAASQPDTPPKAKAPDKMQTVIIRRPGPSTMPMRKPSAPVRPSNAKGNAVYHIDANGLVQTIFRKPVTILSMILQDDRLLLGTGNGGAIYAADVDGDENFKLADTETKQITAMVEHNSELIFASANAGSIGKLTSSYAAKGTFTSKPLDAKQVSRWGTVQVDTEALQGATATVAVRSGMVGVPDDKTWSDWSGEIPADEAFAKISVPSGRFLQYRFTLKTSNPATPVVKRLKIIYQVFNLPPSFMGIKVFAKPVGKDNRPVGTSLVFRHIMIGAADPNRDKIAFDIYYRKIGTKKWIRMAEKISQPKYVWDTRTVSDGKYEIRVVAGDSPSNPPASALSAERISEPVVVDHTLPTTEQLTATLGDGKVKVKGTATDKRSRIVAIQYSVDSREKWKALLPDDGICDSNKEPFSFELDDLKPGEHNITIRTADAFGNISYSSINVTVGK